MTEADFRVAEAIEREAAAVDEVADRVMTVFDDVGNAEAVPEVSAKPGATVRQAAKAARKAAKAAKPAEADKGEAVAVANTSGRAAAEATVAKAMAKAPRVTAEAAPEAEAVEALAYVSLPLAFLRGALACASKEETRCYLQGVHVSARQGVLRACGTDGHRLFVGTVRPGGGTVLPDWLEAGVIIPAEGLKARLALLHGDAEDRDAATVQVGFAANAPAVALRDPHESIVFRMAPVEGRFPDFDRVIGDAANALGDRSFDSLEAPAYQGKYVKQVGDLAAAIGASTVSFFAPGTQLDGTVGASIVTFPDVPGTLLLLMPVKAPESLPAETAAILGPNLRGTLAALKANLTRTLTAIRAAEAGERDTLEAKAAVLRNKIDTVRIAVERALPAPAAEAATEAATVH